MRYELMTDDDYEGLPEPPSERFIALEAICRRNLYRFIAEEDGDDSDDLLRNQYMMMVATSAEALGIEGVKYPRTPRPAAALNNFMVEVTGVVTRLRLRSTVSKKGSVQIAAGTRVQLDVQIRRLRSIIEKGDMAPDRRKALLAQLSLLADEVAKTRLDLSKAMMVLAFVSMSVASGTSFLADAPEAIATIASLIGIDQQAEEAERQRRGAPPPQKSLPTPERPPAGPNAPAFEPSGMDDDIPF